MRRKIHPLLGAYIVVTIVLLYLFTSAPASSGKSRIALPARDDEESIQIHHRDFQIQDPHKEEGQTKTQAIVKTRKETWEEDLVLSLRDPFTRFAPHIKIVWSRGWFNVVPTPHRVPIDYYNRAGRDSSPTPNLGEWITPETCGILWLRMADVRWWTSAVLPKLQCEVTLITSDGADAAPELSGSLDILASPKVKEWYSQNVVSTHDKLFAIPVGLGIHHGFPGSPDSAATFDHMRHLSKTMPTFKDRSRSILFENPGNLRLFECANVRQVPAEGSPQIWKEYGKHQFTIVYTMNGLDTHKLWELLFFGTVPIVKRSFTMENLIESSYLPAVIVDNWNDVCKWTDREYTKMLKRYEDWIVHSRRWLRPSIWVPRKLEEMKKLCAMSSGCSDAAAELKKKPRLTTARVLKAETSKASKQEDPNDVRIVLTGVAKNIKPQHIRCHIPKLIKLGEQFTAYHIVVYMNDSPLDQQNAYKEELAKTPHSTFIYESGVQGGSRTNALALVRNKVLDVVLEKFKDDFNYMLVTDMDGVCGGCDPSQSYDPTVFKRAFQRSSEWDAIFFRFIPFWDLWAFRDKDHMPYNLFGKRASDNKFKVASQFDGWLGSLPRDSLIEVESSFMMLAIYKIKVLDGPRYKGWNDEFSENDCEHVAFHKDIRKQRNGRLRLSPEIYCVGDPGYLTPEQVEAQIKKSRNMN
eukprot:m.63328 g.63328  ORF g.63328 m.63328 type:complete len:693 (+) comp11575_c0_seq1:355-2433(+)